MWLTSLHPESLDNCPYQYINNIIIIMVLMISIMMWAFNLSGVPQENPSPAAPHRQPPHASHPDRPFEILQILPSQTRIPRKRQPDLHYWSRKSAWSALSQQHPRRFVQQCGKIEEHVPAQGCSQAKGTRFEFVFVQVSADLLTC